MIKYILLLVLTSLYLTSTAQIIVPVIITSNDMPNEHDSVQMSVVAPDDYINVGNPSATGTTYTWDYSNLSPNYQQYEKFQSPLDFTTPYNYFFNPFNTSYGRNNYEFSAIPLPNVDISAAYDFFKESSSELKQIGAGYIINDVPLPFLYSQADVVYEFPMTYQSTSSNFYKYGLDIPGIGYYGQSGTRSNVVDGWGTLTTPFGTFQTIRLKSTIDAVDTVYNNTLMAGANIPRPLRHEYKWLANGMKVPVLKIETTVIAGNETISNVRYIDSTRSDVPHLGIADKSAIRLKSTVYPNPCIDELTIAYQLTATAKVKIVMTDIIGKTISTVLNEEETMGQHKQTIEVSELKPGIYFLHIQAGQVKEVQKVIISR